MGTLIHRADANTADYLKTLEEVKKQYRQYVEVSEPYTLPVQEEQEPPESPAPPARINPLQPTVSQFEIALPRGMEFST